MSKIKILLAFLKIIRMAQNGLSMGFYSTKITGDLKIIISFALPNHLTHHQSKIRIFFKFLFALQFWIDLKNWPISGQKGSQNTNKLPKYA